MYGRREPKSGEVETPRFTAVWEAIKHLECVDYDRGTRWGVTGKDVCAILDALDALPKPSTPVVADALVDNMRVRCFNDMFRFIENCRRDSTPEVPAHETLTVMLQTLNDCGSKGFGDSDWQKKEPKPLWVSQP